MPGLRHGQNQLPPTSDGELTGGRLVSCPDLTLNGCLRITCQFADLARAARPIPSMVTKPRITPARPPDRLRASPPKSRVPIRNLTSLRAAGCRRNTPRRRSHPADAGAPDSRDLPGRSRRSGRHPGAGPVGRRQAMPFSPDGDLLDHRHGAYSIPFAVPDPFVELANVIIDVRNARSRFSPRQRPTSGSPVVDTMPRFSVVFFTIPYKTWRALLDSNQRPTA
jgi:hypothetical protein